VSAENLKPTETASEASAVYRAFHRAVRRTPNAEAVEFDGRHWSYLALEEAAQAFAQSLTFYGVHEGDRVAFLGRNSDAYVVGFLASQYLGAIHVPINFMLGSEEVAYILNHAAPKVIYADTEFLDVAKEAVRAARPALHLEELSVAQHSTSEVTLDFGAGASEPRPSQLAYTSGTESAPKGALLSDSGLVYQYLSCISAGDYSSSDITVHALPLYHCAQMHCFLLPGLLLGSKNVILSQADPVRIMDAVKDSGATSLFAPPTVWIGLLGQAQRREAFDTLRKGYYGASIMPTEVLLALRRTWPKLRFWNYYGQTEIGPLATVLRPEEHDQRPASAGRPVLFVETRVVDDHMQDVLPGEIGEVVHRSPQLLLRYYRDPSKTQAAFEGGWFHSGDLAISDEEGYLTIVDRKKDMIKSGGENVSSREVEEVIYRHPAVAEVAVIGVPDTKWIERVCAVIVLKQGATALSDEIIHITGSLAPFKRPKQVLFIEQLPKNPSGKVLKRELRRIVAEAAN
jgi:fatty-acyl-CoA synthase